MRSCAATGHARCLTGLTLPVMVMAMFVALCVTLFVAGCAKPKSKSAALVDPFTPGVYPQIAALDGLARSLSFSSPTVQVGSDTTPMVITVPVRLTDLGERHRDIEYKFEFFEQDGRPAMQQPAWESARLQAGTRHYLQGRSHTRSPRHWRLLMRPAPIQATPPPDAPPEAPPEAPPAAAR